MRVDIAGQVYGRLTAIRDVGSSPQGRIWEFQCSCGNKIEIQAKHVRSGNTQSCGCLAKERASQMNQLYAKERKEADAKRKVPLEKRFWRLVDIENRPMPTTCKGFGPCLIWTGGLDTKGRAQMRVDELTKRASHVAWFLTYGYWPDYLCHRCDNRACVEVNHLFEGDDAANRYDRQAKELGGIQIS